MKVSFKSVFKVVIVGVLGLSNSAFAVDFNTFEPFEISVTNSINSAPRINNSPTFYQPTFSASQSNFDFLSEQDKGYHLTTQSNGIFGEELVVGMKFADWLTFRLNVIDEDSSFDLFSANTSGFSNYPVGNNSEDDLFGYQLGVSSVLNIADNWRLGFDLGKGRVGGEMLGLYHDRVDTTRLGFGIRNKKFGATFQSDFINVNADSNLGQSTMDLQVDWHFNKNGTISFGARKNFRESSQSGTSLDQLTGTVPYIKFKHNL